MNPQEARQIAYIQLVEALLKCPPHLEEKLLAANPELVDLGLVMTMLAVARRMMQQNDPRATPAIEWLVGFAQQLARKLGLEMDESPEEDDEEYRTFVLQLLQTVFDSEGDEARVHAFLKSHLTYLDEHLLAIFPQQLDGLFALKTEPEWKLFIASTLNNLAVDLGEFPIGNRSINLELAIACYDRALSVYTQSDFPIDWATTQNNLASAYRNRIEGDRIANLGLAIQAYQSALKVCTPRKYPIGQSPRFANESGRIQASLEATIDLRDTLIQRDRHHPDIFAIDTRNSSPDRKYQEFFIDLLQAIVDSKGNRRIVHNFFDEHLSYLNEKLLAILPQQVHILLEPEDTQDLKPFVASTLNSLAVDLCQFPRGNRWANLELAIECYRLALEVRTLEAYPEQWAMTQNNLAVAYWCRIRGERAANLEQSIECYRLALEVYTIEAHPEDWAMTQMNLAGAYGDRIRGERAANLEQSIECYRLALEVYTIEAHPEDWARTQMNLAGAYQSRIRGERAANLELAIEYYRLALEVRTLEAYPEQWAMTQMNLATAYWSRIRGERAANLELAIESYRLALNVYTLEAYPEQWAKTQMNLATAYWSRIRRERAANLELAIESYRLALNVYTRADYPEDWARTQMNLAIAYGDRIRGERAANLEESIEYYRLTLEVFTLEAYPEQWARTQMNLAVAYRSRIRGERVANLELAIEFYRLTLEVFTLEAYPEQWARTQMNLAVAYGDRIRGERAANLELAIESYRLALEVFTLEAYPEQWAGRQMNLAILYEGEGLNEVAIHHYQQALEIFKPAAFPINALKANQGLGNIYFRQGSWQLAIHAYETAMQAVETSRSWVVNEESRQELLQNALSIYENAIQCAINLQNYPQAIQFTERIRSRHLVELMETKDFHADTQLPPEIGTYLAEYEDLNHQIQNLRQQPNPNSAENSQLITHLESQKNTTYRQIRSLDPVLAGQIQVTAIDFATIQQLITTPHTAILTCYSTDDATHIFIIKQSGAPTIHTCKHQGWAKFQQWLQTDWITPYHNDVDSWAQNLSPRLHEIAKRLQLDTLITQHLTNINELIIVPHLNLHQIPFAALPITPLQDSENPLLSSTPPTSAPLSERSRTEWNRSGERGGFLLSDRFIIRSIPSCQILQYCQNRPEIKTAIIGTVEDADDTLLGARYEGEQLAALYHIPPTNRLIGSSQATPANYRALLTRVNRLHSSHHATSRPDNPLESALILAQGERITLSDLLMGTRYPDLDEVFLSACETHVDTPTLTDDVATLTTGFLCIGARSVQSTLWSVNDIVTVIFSLFYHQQCNQGKNRAISLHIAQTQLRNLTGAQFAKYHPRIIEYHTTHSPTMISSLVDRITNLTNQQSTLDLHTQKQKWDEFQENINWLHEKVESIEEIPWQSADYCKLDRPFKDPYYWAGFITQGMA
jgi:CHAT domain-containing protein/tetratricopeptide (TPR) repeat protein